RHRSPLPLISARPPSALVSSISQSAPSLPPSRRISPSAPTPRRRSHSAARIPDASRLRPREPRRASRSTSTRKSLPVAWSFEKCSVVTDLRSGQAVPRCQNGREGGERIPVAADPGDAPVAPEPHALPAGELAGALGGAAQRRLERGDRTLEVIKDLLVPDALPGGGRQPAGRRGEAADLLDQPVLHHGRDAGLDALGDTRPRQP